MASAPFPTGALAAALDAEAANPSSSPPTLPDHRTTQTSHRTARLPCPETDLHALSKHRRLWPQRLTLACRVSYVPRCFRVALMISSISCPDLLTTSPARPPIMLPIAAEFIREMTTLPVLV